MGLLLAAALIGSLGLGGLWLINNPPKLRSAAEEEAKKDAGEEAMPPTTTPATPTPPTAPPVDCAVNPTDPSCTATATTPPAVDCKTTPTDPTCSGRCVTTPTDPACIGLDCSKDTTNPLCAGYTPPTAAEDDKKKADDQKKKQSKGTRKTKKKKKPRNGGKGGGNPKWSKGGRPFAKAPGAGHTKGISKPSPSRRRSPPSKRRGQMNRPVKRKVVRRAPARRPAARRRAPFRFRSALAGSDINNAYSTNTSNNSMYRSFPAVITHKEFDNQLSDYYEPDTLLPLFPIDSDEIEAPSDAVSFNEKDDPTNQSHYDEWSNSLPFIRQYPTVKPGAIKLSGVP